MGSRLRALTWQNRFVLSFAFGVLVLFSFASAAVAGSTTFFRGDEIKPQSGSSVWLTAGETTYVRKAEVHVAIYFKGKTDNHIYINDGHYCTRGGPDIKQSGDGISTNPGQVKQGDIVTSYTLVKEAVEGSNTDLYDTDLKGRYYNDHTKCDTPLELKVKPLEYFYDAGLKLYYVKLSAENGNRTGAPPGHIQDSYPADYDGIQNQFSIRATASDGTTPQIWQTGDRTGYGVTMQRPSKPPEYTDYTVRFGASCSVQDGTEESLYFYDLDNGGGSGAQVGKDITVQMFKSKPGGEETSVQFTGAGIGSTYRDPDNIWTWKPNGAANSAIEPHFTIQTGYRYRLVVRDVYYNNTMQFSTPTDGIYWNKTCKNSPPTVTINATCNGTQPYVWGKVRDDDVPDGGVKVDAYYGSGAFIGSTTTDANNKYRVNITYSDVASATKNIRVYARDVDSQGNRHGGQDVSAVISLGPCSTPSISCVLTSPIYVPRGLASSVGVSVTKVGSPVFTSPTAVTIRINGVIPPGGTTNVTPDNSGGLSVLKPSVAYTASSLGSQPVSATVGGVLYNCGTFDVARQPFFTVEGGDTVAGTVEDNGTAENPYANIQAYGGGTAPTFKGAYSQIAAMATGGIKNLPSGVGLGASNTGLLLAFSNQANNVGSGNFGGSLTGVSLPRSDFSILTGAAVPLPSSSIDLGSLTTNVYTYDGPSSTLTLYGVVGEGEQVTIISNVQVYLSGSVAYASTNSLSSIPRLLVKSEADIVVAPTATALHGIFITSGRFITCGSSIPYPEDVTYKDIITPLWGPCNSVLKVYGSVMANQLLLTRTNGNWVDDTAVAEQFIYSPEVWLPRGPQKTGDYDSFIGLPPIL